VLAPPVSAARYHPLSLFSARDLRVVSASFLIAALVAVLVWRRRQPPARRGSASWRGRGGNGHRGGAVVFAAAPPSATPYQEALARHLAKSRPCSGAY
jgi:hypothetical protein